MNDQLSLGGGKLFQLIAKLHKPFLGVGWDSHSSSGDPQQFLNEQNELWSQFWCPPNKQHEHQVLAQEYSDLWDAARLQ